MSADFSAEDWCKFKGNTHTLLCIFTGLGICICLRLEILIDLIQFLIRQQEIAFRQRHENSLF